jgi:hypothetical protein
MLVELPLFITNHARQRLNERGLTVANVEWCVAGGNYFVQANGNHHYTRQYDNGNSEVHAIVAGNNRLVTAWIRGRLDPGV